MCIRYRADASTGEIRGPARSAPRQERRAAIDAGWASHDLAEETCRAGANAPRSRASTPTMASGGGLPRQRDTAAGDFIWFREIQKRRQHRPAARRGPALSAAECGTLPPADARRGVDSSDGGVGGAEIDANQKRRGGIHADRPRGCSAPVSSDERRLFALHQSSSVPISVTRLSSVTGTTHRLPARPGSGRPPA